MSSRRGILRRAAFAGGVGCGILGTARFGAAVQYSWKCGDGAPAELPLNVRLVEAFEKIHAETDGELDIKNFPNSTLGGDPAMIGQLRLGALEMMAEAGGLLDGISPITSMENVPFAFADYEAAFRAFDGDLGRLVRGELYAKGLYAFDRPFDNGFRQLTTSSRPIRTVDDLQGLKLRVNSQLRIDAFRSLGASPTPVVQAELYTALQTHLVDGQESPLIFVEAVDLFEVQRFCSLSNHMWGAFWILVNKEKWNGLPRRLQEVMQRHINAAALQQRRDDEQLENSVRDKLVRRGMQLNEVAAAGFRSKLKATKFYARWRDTWGASAWTALERYSGPLT